MHLLAEYTMVMFHTIPYAEAKRRGAIQEEVLERFDRDRERCGPVSLSSWSSWTCGVVPRGLATNMALQRTRC